MVKKMPLLPGNRLDGFANLGACSFTIFVLVPALEPLFNFGLLALLSLLFFLALLKCLRTTSSHGISFLELHHTLLTLCWQALRKIYDPSRTPAMNYNVRGRSTLR